MAAGGAICRYNVDSFQDNVTTMDEEDDSLHERLVAYVHTLTHGIRRGVWGEHSYARSGAGGARGAGRVRVLLGPPATSPPSGPIDVERSSPPPPEPPAPPSLRTRTDSEPEPDEPEPDWEARLASLAPAATHARLASVAVASLLRMRLERLAGAGASGGGQVARRESARAAARELRRALAVAAASSAAPPAGAWLHTTLQQVLPRSTRRLYDEATEALREEAPLVAARLLGAAAAGGGPARSRACGAAVGPESSPWLVWVASGSAALDARWERRLAARVHTRVLRGAGGVGGAAPPEPWCAAAVAAVRAALTDALAEAGERAVILGGVGAGASVALVLARGAGAAPAGAGGVRGLLLVAPPLLCAEGPRGAPDDALAAVRLPLLLVGGGPQRHLAARLADRNVAARHLDVRPADCLLRVAPAAAARLPQYALDAALVEECVRWALETAEGEEPPEEPPAPPAPRRTSNVIDLCTEEEYAHLPAAAAPACIDIVGECGRSVAAARSSTEGRMVSRGSGGTPLALVPPRRAPPPAPAPGPLGAADIMQLPIVFADDERPLRVEPESSPGSGVTVTSGEARGGRLLRRGGPSPPPAPDKLAVSRVSQRVEAEGGGGGAVKLTRVILAKRGARGGGAPGGASAGGGRGPGGAARRVLLRRGVRILPHT